MPDYSLDDPLLAALREARPADVGDQYVPDNAKGAALLARIMTVNADIGDALDVVTTPARFSGSPVAEGAAGKPIRRRHLLAPLAAIAAAAILIGGILVPLTTNFGRRTAINGHVTAPSAWVLAGDISQPAWQVQTLAGFDPYELTCPSTTTCYAAGPTVGSENASGTGPDQSVVEITHAGGVTWEQSLLPGAGIDIYDITCPSVTTCMLVGGAQGTAKQESMFTTTNGGRSWNTVPMPGRAESAQLLSCGTPSECVSLESEPGPGGQGLRYVSNVTTDGGITWSSSDLPGTFRAQGLTCDATGRCIATGSAPIGYVVANASGSEGSASVIYSADGGLTWNSGSVPAGVGTIGSISCADSLHCMAIGNSLGNNRRSWVVITADGGRTWMASPSTVVSDLNLGAISCPTGNQCWISGSAPSSNGLLADGKGVLLATSDGGQIWTPEDVPTDQGAPLRHIGAIACPAASACLALANPPSAPSSQGQQLVLSNGESSQTNLGG